MSAGIPRGAILEDDGGPLSALGGRSQSEWSQPMNLRYLGDALDHWKGSLFERLQRAKLLRAFAVDAMATDAEDWQAADLALFADLLRLQPSQILSHRHILETERAA